MDVSVCKVKSHDVKLEVLQSGMTLTVKAGDFKVRGEDYTLAEDWTYTAVSDAHKWVAGYLMLDGEGQVMLGVQEVVVGDAVKFDWKGSSYTELHQLFMILDIYEGVSSLDDAAIRVSHLGSAVEGGGDA